MKKKSYLALLIAVFMVIGLFSSVYAAEAVEEAGAAEPAKFDPDAEVSLTVVLKDPLYHNTLEGFPVYVWKVADIAGNTCHGISPVNFKPTEDFKEFWDKAGIIENTEQ